MGRSGSVVTPLPGRGRCPAPQSLAAEASARGGTRPHVGTTLCIRRHGSPPAVVSLLRVVPSSVTLAHMDARRRLAALPDTRQAPQLLTVDEVGARLGCSRRTVFRLLGERAFPSIKVGRRRHIAAADVDAYLDTLRAT
jgi:excisionase family DNA binding protein